MQKIYKSLTPEQLSRGVIFSSQLQPGTTIHEVTKDMTEREQREMTRRLLNDSFFDNSPYKYNEIRTKIA